jgi:hypothetical protein
MIPVIEETGKNANITYIILDKFKAWQIILFSFLILFGFIFFTWQMVLTNKQAQVSHTQKEFKILLQSIETVTNEIRFLARVKTKSLEKKLKQQKIIASYSKKDFNILSKRVINNLSDYKINLVSFKSEKSKTNKKKGINASKVNMILHGKYENIGEYLFYLETLAILYQVNKMVIISKDEIGKTVEIELEMELYYL